MRNLDVGEMDGDEYRPIREWGLFAGSRVTEDRIAQLGSFQFSGLEDVSLDDIVAMLGRKFPTLLWSIGAAVEQCAGESTAGEVYYNLGYSFGNAGWQNLERRFHTNKLTPAQVAWYQDMAHIFDGPHAKAHTVYTESVVVVTRADYLLTIPPRGIELHKEWVRRFSDGYLTAYRERAPYLEISLQMYVADPGSLAYPIDIRNFPTFAGRYPTMSFYQLLFKWLD
jgi:hypothetical protein